MKAFFETHVERVSAFVHSGMHFPLHLHSQLELFYMIHGESEVVVQQQSRVMKPGELAVIFPNQIHSYAACSEDAEAAVIICELRYTGAFGVTLLSQHPMNPFLCAEQLHGNVPYAVQEIVQEMKEKRENSAAYAPLIQLILSRVLPCMELQGNENRDMQEATNEIVQYIGSHFREHLTLDVLAKELGMSKYHISHLFSEKIKESFPSYLNHMRLLYACEKLCASTASITEIAMDAGFESQRTFFRAFKQRYGMTPAQYRYREWLG